MYVIRLSFNGAGFHGWQSQPDVRTVQDELKSVLARVFKSPNIPFPAGCSRTDTGVHALDYLATIPCIRDIPPDALTRGVNSLLPPDVRVRSISTEPSYRDARALVAAKHYRYVVFTGTTKTPFNNPLSWQCIRPPDIGEMRQAAEHIVGTHDFSSFQAAGASVKTTVRTVHRVEITEQQPYIFIDVTGTGFLKHMVRIVSGTLVYVGRGKLSADEIPAVIGRCDRDAAGPTLPGKGLYLMRLFRRESTALSYPFEADHGDFIWKWPDLCKE